MMTKFPSQLNKFSSGTIWKTRAKIFWNQAIKNPSFWLVERRCRFHHGRRFHLKEWVPRLGENCCSKYSACHKSSLSLCRREKEEFFSYSQRSFDFLEDARFPSTFWNEIRHSYCTESPRELSSSVLKVA